MGKTILICMFAANLLVVPGQAQRLSITTHAGYVFDDHISSGFQEFKGEVKGGVQWGIGMEYSSDSAFGLELLYLRQDTKSRITLSGGQETTYDLAINYILLTGSNYFRLRKNFFVYPGSVIGVAILNVKNPTDNDGTSAIKFTFGIKAGLSYWVSKKISFRLQSTLLATIQAVGGKLYFGSSGIGYTSLLQFNAGGGIVLHLTPFRKSSK